MPRTIGARISTNGGLSTIRNDNPGIKLEPWGLEELRVIFRRLSVEDVESWFGPTPTEETKAHLGFKDLQVVLERIEDQSVPSDQPVKDVPKGKIEANALSENVAALLKAGMAKAPLVQAFFDQWHDATLGERIATSFRSKYELLREDHPPNIIFSELWEWAGGKERGTAEHEMAVLAVLAYFFERCDIFEGPRENKP